MVRVVAALGLSCVLIAFHGCGHADSSTPPYAPQESPHKVAYYRYATPPVGFTAAVGWMQAIDILGTGATSTVEVDWMRVHAVVNGIDTIILEDTFDVHTGAMDGYGLYSRNPWFAGDKLAVMPFTISNGTLMLNPGANPNRVYHWWNTSRCLIDPGTTRVWFEARVRVSGGAGVQAGLDYWKDLSAPYAGHNVNNTEAGTSNWYGNSTAEWQVISVGHP